jgi:hypothetical protein
MSKNKLFEAAAEILASSKSGAPAMPPQKLNGEVVDLGGPTPQNSKPDDNSNKIDATKAAKSATAPTTKPSAASSQMPSTKLEEVETEEEVIAEEETSDEPRVTLNLATYLSKKYGTQEQVTEEEQKKQIEMKEDIAALFGNDESISEEFKLKAATIFEARVFDRLSQLEEELEGHYATMLSEAVEQVKEDLAQKVDDYLNYVVEQWMEKNEIAIESGLRSELTEDFINGLRNLFTEHYINIPEEKVDLVEELSTKVEELQNRINEEVQYNVQIRKQLIESIKNEIAVDVCEGLTFTQFEKIKTLAESVEFSTEEEYKLKLETIRENYFPSGAKKATESQLQEQVEDGTEKPVIQDEFVSAVSKAISKVKV